MHPPQRQQRVAEDARVAAKGRGRIDVDGRAHLVGDARKRHLFGVERAVDQRKMVHQFSGGRSKGSGARSCDSFRSSSSRRGRVCGGGVSSSLAAGRASSASGATGKDRTGGG